MNLFYNTYGTCQQFYIFYLLFYFNIIYYKDTHYPPMYLYLFKEWVSGCICLFSHKIIFKISYFLFSKIFFLNCLYRFIVKRGNPNTSTHHLPTPFLYSLYQMFSFTEKNKKVILPVPHNHNHFPFLLLLLEGLLRLILSS